eukprot:4108054-Amphidinium_carterae.1
MAYSSASAELKAIVDCVRLMCNSGTPQHIVIEPLVLFRVVLHPAQSESALDSIATLISPL